MTWIYQVVRTGVLELIQEEVHFLEVSQRGREPPARPGFGEEEEGVVELQGLLGGLRRLREEDGVDVVVSVHGV